MKQHFIIVLLFSFAACGNSKGPVESPPHYNLADPEKLFMPNVLFEISGIAFSNKGNDTIYAEQDEEGKLFHFKLGDNKTVSTKFGKKGDYEDVAIYTNIVFMLRSDGVLYSFPLAEANNKDAGNVQEWNNLLPKGEYEAMYADEATGKLYILCKHCGDDKTSRAVSGYIFAIAGNGGLTAAGGFEINVKDIEKIAGDKKIAFHPSALAKNNATNEWYIVSSVNSMLVVTGDDFTIKKVYPLSRSVFNQPEGIAFDKSNNLYISNEGGTTTAGNILKFAYKQ
jgi:hypothetical protein